MVENIERWKKVVTILHEALPQIDKALSEDNIPISERSFKAFEIVQHTMLDIPDYKAFLVSEAHGRLRIIVSDWFKGRYGDEANSSDGNAFWGMVMIHDTPFMMRVPKEFRTRADEPNMIWVGWPASVQNEEDPLVWVDNKAVMKNLSQSVVLELRHAATATASLIRSIGFDLRSLLTEGDQAVVDLASAIGSDLQASARHLCERNDAGLRSSGWDASQCTEKALKLFIRRKGQSAPQIHDLERLATIAESLGLPSIDRVRLGTIPSNSKATGMRYGGQVELAASIAAYEAALAIVRDVLYAAKPDSEFDVREARFKMKRPPWFEFDSDEFREQLCLAIDPSD